jgi:hypothetical protein
MRNLRPGGASRWRERGAPEIAVDVCLFLAVACAVSLIRKTEDLM